MFEKIIARLTRMIKMDHTVYDEIAVDEDATIEAAIIVVASALASALGAVYGPGGFWGTLLSHVALWWLLWSLAIWIVGSKLFSSQSTFLNILRVLGYIAAPMVLGLIPWIGNFVGTLLSLVLAFFAIRETMDLSTERTVLTVIIGWVIGIVVWWVLPF